MNSRRARAAGKWRAPGVMEKQMKRYAANTVALAILALTSTTGVQYARSQTADVGALNSGGASAQSLQLTAAQRSAIYAAVSNDKSKVAPQPFPTAIGADVPPMIELYALPDEAAAPDPTIKFYKYTMVLDQVVLVDPTKMRVVATIGPASLQ
jgi:uncharacterized protein DUF1236